MIFMINELARKLLALKDMPEGCIGYDCDARVIKNGDLLEVVKENEMREGSPEYSFCGVGKRGRASMGSCFPTGWFVTVTFGCGQSAGCVDYYTRIVT